MASREPFRSPKLRLRRAKQHARRFEKQSKAFMDTVPYISITEPDANGITQSHKIRLLKSIPDSCEVAATEAIEALRSTLDHIGAAAAVAAGALKPTSAKFPFGDTPADVENDIRRGCKDLPADIQTLFRGFQPYEGGNNTLWALNKLRNPAQHRILAAVSPAVWRLRFHELKTVGGAITAVSEWDGSKNEITTARSRLGTEVHFKAEAGMFVTFAEPELIRSDPAALVLNAIASEVERVLVATEAECRRLGLIR